jgi:hypothetical protein
MMEKIISLAAMQAVILTQLHFPALPPGTAVLRYLVRLWSYVYGVLLSSGIIFHITLPF